MEPKKILCPICGDNYVHTNSPDEQEDKGYRQGKIVIPMWCEGGHHWDVCFGHHKGETFIFYENFRHVETLVTPVDKLPHFPCV